MIEEELEYLSSLEMDEYEKLLAQEKAYGSFRAFIEYTMPNYFFNWHHEIMIEILEGLMTTQNRRVMIWTAPRHGKSELVSRRFPAYFLGRNPDARVIACSYSASLSTMFNRDVQRIMETKEYHEIFPDTLLPNAPYSKDHPDNAKYKRTTSMFELIGRNGYLLSPGVGGSITGLGADLFLIDDPVKNQEEALSETTREAVFAWYNSTAYTRLEKGANIAICQTRWHKHDLSGKLIEEMEMGGEKWEIINLPAIATKLKTLGDPRKTGEALWPDKYDENRLSIIKRQVGGQVWSALYQQTPTIEGGNFVKMDWFRYYTETPFDRQNWREAYTITSWDLSFKKTGGSYVVGMAIARYKSSYYVLDIVRFKADFPETKRAIKKMAEQFPKTRLHLIEDKANGPAIISELKKEMSGILAVQAVASKEERLHAIAPTIEAGDLYLPANHPLTKVVVEELISFPNSDNDDCVDALSQGILRFQEMKGLRHLRAMTKW